MAENKSDDDFPKPTFITGGCACGALRYRVDFPSGYDFGRFFTCQCTRCRRITSGLIAGYRPVKPFSLFQWLPPALSTELPEDAAAAIAEVATAPGKTTKQFSFNNTGAAGMTFCSECGSTIYYKDAVLDGCSIMVGTIDPLFLWGDGAGEAEAKDVPSGGFSRALLFGSGTQHEWCGNEIPGVTDPASCPVMGSGKRWLGNSEE